MRFSVVTCDVSGSEARTDVFEAEVAVIDHGHLTFRNAATALVRAYRPGHWLQFSEAQDETFPEYEAP